MLMAVSGLWVRCKASVNAYSRKFLKAAQCGLFVVLSLTENRYSYCHDFFYLNPF